MSQLRSHPARLAQVLWTIAARQEAGGENGPWVPLADEGVQPSRKAGHFLVAKAHVHLPPGVTPVLVPGKLQAGLVSKDLPTPAASAVAVEEVVDEEAIHRVAGHDLVDQGKAVFLPAGSLEASQGQGPLAHHVALGGYLERPGSVVVMVRIGLAHVQTHQHLDPLPPRLAHHLSQQVAAHVFVQRMVRQSARVPGYDAAGADQYRVGCILDNLVYQALRIQPASVDLSQVELHHPKRTLPELGPVVHQYRSLPDLSPLIPQYRTPAQRTRSQITLEARPA